MNQEDKPMNKSYKIKEDVWETDDMLLAVCTLIRAMGISISGESWERVPENIRHLF